MKILVCGDSFAITDPAFPGLHWSDKILDHSADYEVCNLAAGGVSNAMITMQLLQGLKLNPDFVIFSFTNEGRYEIDADVRARPRDVTAQELADFQKRRWVTNCFVETVPQSTLDLVDRYRIEAASENFEWLKNYFYIVFCLQTVATRGIRFAYSLGGFEYQCDWQQNLRRVFVENMIAEYVNHELAVNLWHHNSMKKEPMFHVADDSVHELFANECIARIKGNYES